MTTHEERRARVAVYRATLEHLLDLTTEIAVGPMTEEGRNRSRGRLGEALGHMEAELAHVASTRVAELVAIISEALRAGCPHDPAHVIELALRMAEEVDADLVEIAASRRS